MTSPLDRLIAPILDRMAALEAKVRTKVSVHSGTITSINPTRVQFDGEDAPKPITPQGLATLMPGDRVLLMHHGRSIYTILDRLGGSGAMLLDQTTLSGSINNSPTLRVPTHLRATVRKFTIDLIGGNTDSTTGNTHVSVHINGDSGSNYRDTAASIGSGGFRTTSHRAATSAPRTMYVAQFLGYSTVDFMVSNYLTYWSGRGWQNDGAGAAAGGVFISGGRWDGDGLDIHSFDLRAAGGSWVPGSRVQLWGHR